MKYLLSILLLLLSLSLYSNNESKVYYMDSGRDLMIDTLVIVNGKLLRNDNKLVVKPGLPEGEGIGFWRIEVDFTVQ